MDSLNTFVIVLILVVAGAFYFLSGSNEDFFALFVR